MHPAVLTPKTSHQDLQAAGELCIKLVEAVPRKSAKLSAILNCLPRVEPEWNCLDIGTGNGGVAHYYASVGKWTFLDYFQGSLSVAQRILKGRFVVADAHAYLSGKEKYHLITCVDSLTYSSDWKLTLKCILEALDSGGLCLIIEPKSSKTLDPLILIRHLLGVERARGARTDFSYTELRARLGELGFQMLTTRTFCGPFCQLAQTVLDVVKICSTKGENPANHDTLTMTFDDKPGKPGRLIKFLGFLKTLTFIANFLDKIFFFLPRSSYTIVVQKAYHQ